MIALPSLSHIIPEIIISIYAFLLGWNRSDLALEPLFLKTLDHNVQTINKT